MRGKSFSSYRGGAAMWDSVEPIKNATWLFAIDQVQTNAVVSENNRSHLQSEVNFLIILNKDGAGGERERE